VRTLYDKFGSRRSGFYAGAKGPEKRTSDLPTSDDNSDMDDGTNVALPRHWAYAGPQSSGLNDHNERTFEQHHVVPEVVVLERADALEVQLLAEP
jgi:hypothetical protein